MRLALLAALILFVAAIFVPAGFVFATHPYTTSGFAWSGDNLDTPPLVGPGSVKGGIGWISFSCENTLGVCLTRDYGVEVDPGTGQLSGYAWNGNDGSCDNPATPEAESCGIGWISFQVSEISDFGAYPGCGFPTPPCQVAQLDLVTRRINGWGRAYSAIAGFSPGGWDGWIKFSGDTIAAPGPPPEYGWTIPVASCAATGYAWGGGTNGPGSEVIGWISGSGTTQSGTPYGVSTSGGVCIFPPVVDNNTPPVAVPNPETDFCSDRIVLKWQYSDSNVPSSPQSQYQVQVSSDFTFASDVRDSLMLPGAASNCFVEFDGDICGTPTGLPLTYGITYYWHVRVRNTPDTPTGNPGLWSSWTAVDVGGNPEDQFATPPHSYPNAALSVPLFAFVGQPVKLDNNSTDFVPTPGNTSFYSEWTITQGGLPSSNFICEPPLPVFPDICTPATGTIASAPPPEPPDPTPLSPLISFTTAGIYSVNLEITDDDGHDCRDANATIFVGSELPNWREITPKP